MKKKKPLLIFKGKGHTKENIELKASKDAYFQAMLIFKYHSFGKRLFSSHAYFQVRAYFRENTVRKKHEFQNQVVVFFSYSL